MFSESVVDDVLLEALFVRLCYWSEEALFLGSCSLSEAVDDVLLEAVFLG